MTEAPEWREPNADECALFDVLALAAIPNREQLAAQLAHVRIGPDADHAGFMLDVPVEAPRIAADDGELLAAEGLDAVGARVLVAIHLADGTVRWLELSGLDGPATAWPRPETLRLMTAVPRGTLALRWMVPHERTILDESRGAAG
jgi:hypothetical protein